MRFETNRMLTGTGHERYVSGQDVWGHRPPDELARRLLARDNVAGLQVHGNMVTVDLNKGYDAGGIAEVIENLYRFYPDVEKAVDSSSEAVTAQVLSPEGAEEDEPAAEAASTEA
ncbi:MAG: hypothetical protein KDB02_09765 [Acidimicrobiales bacterium]|nr:hypothetical protein [Acidimicrobiales bacterium]